MRLMKSGLFLATPLLLAAALASAEPVTVSWRDKPPYYYLEDGIAKGFMLDYAKEVFATAGIEAQFVHEPQKRIWARFADGTRNYCSLSWYRMPEREALAQYSLPVYTDPPHTILVASAALERVRAHATLASLMTDPGLTLAVIDGVSYGPELDARIRQSTNQIMRRTVPTTNMMQMLAAGRASYMLADRNDWNHLRTRSKQVGNLTQYDVPDLPPGLKRHIVCSRDVPGAVMDRLNQAIRITAKPGTYDK
jgi:polar amino acid transport system substrate-binding protein